MSGVFQYSPLTRKREIRLVKVYPVWGTSSIRCSFRYVSLDEKPSYRAISYRWGPLQPREMIGIKSIEEEDVNPYRHGSDYGWLELETSESLSRLLRWLGTPKRPSGWYWIDALCINQQNVDEKSIQVQLMIDIYAGAEQVDVWLGQPADDSNLALEFVPKLETAFQQIRTVDEDINMERLSGVDGCGRNSKGWQALRALLKRSWFSRAWIVQEVAVAKSVTLHCGSATLAWESLKYVLQEDFASGLHQLTWNESWGYKSRPDTMDISLLHSIGELYRLRRLPSLYTNLIYFRAFDATDPRDHVYAFLGISTNRHDSEFKPDYRERVEELFTRTARHLLFQQSHDGPHQRMLPERILSLQVTHCPLLHAAGIGWKRKYTELPSWVPDWTATKRDLLGACEEIGRYNATIGTTLRVSRGPDNASIVLMGHNVDVVDKLYLLKAPYDSRPALTTQRRPSNRSRYTDLRPPLEWVTDVQSLIIADPYPGAHRRSGGNDRDEIVSNTLTANLLCNRSPLDLATGNDATDIANDFNSFNKAAAHAVGEYPFKDIWEGDYKRAQFVRIVMGMSEDRVLFSTRQGLLGLGPPLLQRGDSVVLIQGTSTPFLLRMHLKRRWPSYKWIVLCVFCAAFLSLSAWTFAVVIVAFSGSIIRQKRWKIVGESYIHGLMEGDGMKLAKEERIIVD
jgi:hypothetical protein